MSGGDEFHASEALIPGLPDDIAAHVLALIPYSHHARLRPTSRSWRAFLSPPALLPLRRRTLPQASLSHLLCIFPSDPSLSPPYLLDPSHRPPAWHPLPASPCRLSLYGLSNFAALALGPRLFVLGGALFDARSFPIDRPRPSSAVFSLDLASPAPAWLRRSPMIHPRAGFACAAHHHTASILVAGGGARHHLFGPAGGERLATAEQYDAVNDRWAPLEVMPAVRAGCAGFMVGKGEFWVVGGYGDPRTISGVFPVEEYYRDGVVLDLDGGGWRETGDMWAEGQRWRLESIVAVEDLDGPSKPGIFMLDGHDIFRYDKGSNVWSKESTLPRKTPPDSSSGFVALGGELYVMFVSLKCRDAAEYRLAKNKVGLFIQIYCPRKRKWRLMSTKTPFWSLNFKTAVLCTIRV